MFISIGTALAGLFGKQVTDKAAKIIGIASLVVLVLIGVALFFVIHDHNVIKNHDARQEAKVQTAIVGADRYAGEQKTARDQDFSNSQAAVTTAITTAVADHPAETKKPVGPASQSYYDELRRQKAAKKGKSK